MWTIRETCQRFHCWEVNLSSFQIFIYRSRSVTGRTTASMVLMFALITRKVYMCIYINIHTQTHLTVFQTYNRNFCVAKTKIKLIVSISSFEPLLRYAANFTDLLGSDTACHSNLCYSYKQVWTSDIGRSFFGTPLLERCEPVGKNLEESNRNE